MTFILLHLKNIVIKSKILKFIINKKTVFNAICIGAVVGTFGMTVMASGLTIGYNVSVDDKVIAIVGSEADFKTADNIIDNMTEGYDSSKDAINPEFRLTLTVSEKINTTAEIVDAIIENNDNIVKATGLKVNGMFAACVEKGDIKGYLNEAKTRYYIENAENSAEFTDKIDVIEGYFVKTNTVDFSVAKEVIDKLEVKTVSKVNTDYEIPFETKNVKNDEKPIGYSEVTQKGVNGITRKVEEVVTVNGKKTSSTEISKTVVKEQVPQIVSIGTKVQTIAATTKANAASAGFIFPITSKYFISTYYGEGSHRGIDFATDSGNPIFAVAAGKVVYSGFRKDYGYNIIIEHANGIRTRYAHASALCVREGDVVAQGDMIATVGSTGWSTGSHLHFEVIIGGNRVNPAPYLGMK